MIVFDIDGTIAEAGEPVEYSVAEKIRNLEQKNIQIVLASGKNNSYLTGFARGIGLRNLFIIAENGCVISKPSEFLEIFLVEKSPKILKLKKKVIQRFEDRIWLQPNKVQLTIFPKDLTILSEITNFIKTQIKESVDNLKIYVNVDSIDVLPNSIDKGIALRKIKELSGTKDDIIAVGDGENDVPMLEEAKIKITIREKLKYIVDAHNFKNIITALDYIFSII
ncbi:MAG: HAD-IIB family hydrolase [Promethearchaeota archaeon]